MAPRPEVDPAIVRRLGDISRVLPQTREEIAWTGVRWRVRAATFAHVVRLEDGWPPAYAEAVGASGPLTLLTFRSPIAELDPRHYAERPFFRPKWFRDMAGLVIDAHSDWEEIEALVRGSYCALAPKTLAALVSP